MTHAAPGRVSFETKKREPDGAGVIFRGNERLLKIPVAAHNSVRQLESVPGRSGFLVTLKDQIVRLNNAGEVEFEVPRTNDFKATHVLPESGRFLVQTKSQLVSYDSRTGELQHKLDLTPDSRAKVFTQGDELALYQDGKLQLLNSKLETVREISVEKEPGRVGWLEDGKVIVSATNHLEVFGPDGESRYEYDGRFTNLTVAENGQLHFSKDKTWTRVDLETGRSNSTELKHRPERLLPHPNGTMVAEFRNDLTKHRFVVLTSEGREIQNVPVRGKSLDAELSKDAKSLLVLSRQWEDEPSKQVLYRIELETPKENDSLLSLGFGMVADRVGLSQCKEVVYQTEGHRADRFAQLADGKLVMVGADGITTMDAEGKKIDYSESLETFIENHDQRLHNRDPFRWHPAETLEADLRRREKFNDYVEIPQILNTRGASTSYGMVQFAREAHTNERFGSQEAKLSEDLLFSSRDQRSFWNSGTTGKVFIETAVEGVLQEDYVVVETVEAGKGVRTKLWLDDYTKATALMPLSSGDRNLVAVGTDRGEVFIFEPSRQRGELSKFRLEGSIQSLGISPEGKLLAISEGGDELHWGDDEPLQSSWTKDVETKFEDDIEFEEDVIKVGDFDLTIAD